MPVLLREVIHACRSIARMPATALVVILSIGAGIGVNTTVFSFLQDRVLRPLPGVAHATAIHLVEPTGERGMFPGTSWPEYLDLSARLTSFDGVFAFRMQPLTIGSGADAERASGMLVSGNYFDLLGMQAAAGRLIGTAEAARTGGEPVAVISYEYWQQRFAGAPDAIGSSLRVNNQQLTIVGVTPASFKGTVIGIRIEVWVPATLAPLLQEGSQELELRSLRAYQMAGRLAAGATVARAQTELSSAMADLERAFPESNRAIGAAVLPFWQAPRGPQRMLARSLFVLQGLMLVLLLGVCGNTATLLLARAAERRQEMGIRLAIGARPARVIRLMLVENTVLALLGAGTGAAIAAWLTPRFAAIPLTTGFPVSNDASVDAAGLAFAAALGVLSALLFGLVPAIHLARIDPLLALRGARGSSRVWLRRVLMASQAAVAVAVLVAAGFFLRGLQQTRNTDPGFDQAGVLLARYDLTAKIVPPSAGRRFAEQALVNLRASAGVSVAAIAQQVPLDIHGLPRVRFTIEGLAPAEPGGDASLSNVVTPGYFNTMRIALLAGRDFVDLADTAAPREAIVNRAFAERFLDSAEPLGRRLLVAGRSYTIVGVAQTSIANAFSEPPAPCVFFSYRDRPAPVGQIHARAAGGNEAELAAALREAVASIDPSLAIYDVRSLGEHVDANLGLQKIPARLFMFVGPLLLALAAIGIYAVVAGAVTQRTSEIGVRLALGATASTIISAIVSETLTVVMAGAAAGWLAALAAYSRLTTTPIDPVVFAAPPVVLIITAALASWAPARRTAAIDPVIALKTP